VNAFCAGHSNNVSPPTSPPEWRGAAPNFIEVNDLRWSTVQQRSIVEVRVFTKDNQTLQSSALPNLRVGGRQQIAIKKMFGFVTLRLCPRLGHVWVRSLLLLFPQHPQRCG
jgi:hypothetical protein